MAADKAELVLPGWFLRAAVGISGVLTAVLVAAASWAWSVDRTVTRIDARLESRDVMWQKELDEIKRRLDRLEK